MKSFQLTTMALLPLLLRAFAPVVTTQRRALASTALNAAAAAAAEEKIPMTLLSGFLGSGKTCTLKHLLENTEGVRIGVIVNDVASVNIDAKLISGTSSDGGMVELQNGCACCSLADELLTSVDTLTNNPNRKFDALVVELSGVADPVAIKSNWNMAKMNNHPATLKTDVTKVVTLVDACTFGSDWMTYDMAASRDGWTEEGDDCAGQRKVTELLAEQVECADLILVNKIDMATADEIKVASSVARGLNAKASLETVEFGKITPAMVLGNLMSIKEEPAHADEDCEKPGCTDTSRAHSHDHATEAVCAEPACTDTSHSHDHAEHATEDCAEPGCTDPSHSHDHAGDDCADPGCTDTTHSHSHTHGTELEQLGITNFVYKRSIPFHAKRLLDLLNEWPVPIKENLDLTLMQEAQKEGYSISGVTNAGSPFVGVLRSKGFVWLAPNKWMGANDDAYRHDTAMYWSHAGKHFGISSAGKWWGTIPKDQIKQYFPNSEEEYNRIMTEDFVSDEFGDRRQELVFIGTKISEDEISKALDKCLLKDFELKRYRQEVSNFNQMLLNVKTSTSGGLFDVGGMDQYDPNYNQ